MATQTPTAPAPADPAPKKRGFRFPTAFTVLFFVLLIVWGLTFVIKPGSYAYVSCDGDSAKPIPGSYEQVEVEYGMADRLYDLLLSPVNGLYGIRTPPEALAEAFLRVSRRLRRETQRRIAPLGLNLHQSRALRVIGDAGPLRPSFYLKGLLPITIDHVLVPEGAAAATAMRPLLGSDHRGQRAVVQLQQGL